MESLSRRAFLRGTCATAAGLTLADLVGPGPRPAPVEAEGLANFPAPEAMDRVIARALGRGGDYADLFVERRLMTTARLVDGAVQSYEHGVLQGGGVRTLQGEQTGYAYAETLDTDALAAVAATAAEIATHSGGVQPVAVEPVEFARHIRAQREIAEATVAERTAVLERVDQAARAVDPSIQQVSVQYFDSDQTFAIATSEGRYAEDRLPMIYLRVTVNAVRGDRRAEGSFRTAQRAGMEFFDGGLAAEAGRRAAEQAVRMLEAAPAPGGELPVVIAAGGGVMFHEAVGHGLEADGVLRDASVFAGRVGERVASELVTLYDDATPPGKRGSFNVDDEALSASRTLLIERGRLVGYLQDWRTAHRMGVKRTANGRRQSLRHPPLVRMTNTNVAPGEHDPEAIIKETPRGIYAVDFGGGEVDTVSGQFTFGLREAYLIEDGRVTTPIKGANLVGSGIQVLERIDRVGNDFGSWPGTCGKGGQWVPVTSGCPTLRIARITVGGTA